MMIRTLHGVRHEPTDELIDRVCSRSNARSQATVTVRRSVLVRAARAVAHGGLVIGMAGAGVMASVCLLLGGTPPIRLLAMAFCVSASSYAIDRIVDLKRDAHLVRTRELARMRALLPVSAVLFAIAVALGATSAHPETGMFALMFPLSVALYVTPWMRTFSGLVGSHARRIKDIPLAKSFYVPACWALMVPWALPFFPSSSYRQAALAVAFLFPSLFITAAACDLRDEEADRLARVLTFPVLLGKRRTIQMLQTIQSFATTVFVMLWAAGCVPGVVALLSLSGVAVYFCLSWVRRPDADIAFFCDFGFDLLWILQPLPALIAALVA